MLTRAYCCFPPPTGRCALQDRKAVEKKKEQDKAKEKQQEELSKQRQIEKVTSQQQAGAHYNRCAMSGLLIQFDW